MDLKKELKLADVFSITVGSMISAGLFVIPGIAYARAGPASALAYLLAAVIALPTMLSAAELITVMPRAGGVYYFVSRSLGGRMGTIAGFARWFAMSLKSAFSLIGIGIYFAFAAGIGAIYISVTLCLFFVFINLLGIKLVGRAQTLFTIFLAGILLFLAFCGMNWLDMERFSPFAPHGISSIFSTAGFVFVSYGGMLAITGLAEEVKEPETNIPLGMLLSLAFTGVIYTLTVFVIIGSLEPETLRNTLAPVSEVASISLGRFGILLATTAALLAFITTANAGIASASRYPLAMSRDGLVPSFFKKVSSYRGIPYFSILFTGGFILLAMVFLSIEVLVETASALLMLTYILTNLAVIILRKKKNPAYQPRFSAPLYPWIQLFGIGGLLLLIVNTSFLSLMISLLFLGISFAWYQFYARHKAH